MTDVSEPGGESIDTARFRQALGHFATGISVVTAVDDGDPVGLAVGSFFSVSLAPPLVGFCAADKSTSWPHIRKAGVFCANVLAADQEAVCRVFASSGGEKFRELGWKPSGSGSPILTDVLAWVDCHIDAVHDAGDHEIVVGRVQELDVAREAEPLLFYRGGYAQLT